MIKNRSDFYYYLDQDRKALGIKKPCLSDKIKQFIWPNEVWKFEILLRKTEYYKNIEKPAYIFKFLYIVYAYRLKKQSLKLGFTIPCNVFGPGLSIAHYGTIVVNGKARVGANCRLHANTNIGASAGRLTAPQIGDNCYIGPGAIIFGDIQISNNVTIGANATVNKSFLEENIAIAGTPAKVVKTDMKNWTIFNKITL